MASRAGLTGNTAGLRVARRRATTARRLVRAAAFPLGVFAISSLALIGILRLWHLKLGIPITGYAGDGNAQNESVKDLIEHGWIQTNPDLGAPHGQELWDYAVAGGDTLQWVALKAIVLFTHQWAVVVNLYALLSYPLIAVVSYGVLRRFRLSKPVSAATSILFTMLPYHFVQMQGGHLFLSTYYAVPLSLGLVIPSLLGEPMFAWTPRPSGRRVPTRRTVANVVFVLIIAMTGIYYAFFAIVLLGFAALLAVARRSRRGTVEALAAAAAIGVVVIANFTPNLVYTWEHGKDAAVGQRQAAESETYATKLSDLVMPVTGDRIGPLSNLKTRYNATALPPPDYGVSLGLIGTAGLTALGITLVLAATGIRRFSPLMQYTSVLALFTVLTITVGGLSSLFAYLVSPTIRGWYRFGIVVGFLALLGAAIVAERVGSWLRPRRFGRAAFLAGLALATAFGLLEQTSNLFVPAYAATAAQWKSDTVFAQAIQRTMPVGAEILSLPYTPFPESVVGGIDSYDEGRPYLHTTGLRWSWGAMKGRPADWIAAFQGLPVSALVRRAAASGFLGLYIDRPGYGTADAHVEAKLAKELAVKPAVSADGTQAFYDLRPYRRRLRSELGSRRMHVLAETTLNPVFQTFGTTFFGEETGGGKRWRWSDARDGEIMIDNAGRRVRSRVFTTTLSVAGPPADVTIAYPDGTTATLPAVKAPVQVRHRIRLQPGTSTIRITTDAKAYVAPPDPRTLFFALTDTALR